MRELIILKLGGSILTEKKGRGRIRVSFVRDFSKQFAGLWRKRFAGQGVGVILLHGAGSFGHPLVHQYSLLDSFLSKKTIRGFGHVLHSTRTLTSRLSSSLFEEGVPVVPLQSGLVFEPKQRGEAVFRNGMFQFLSRVIRAGGVPVLGGDLGAQEDGVIGVLSADAIAVALAKKFGSTRLFFATDVSGVYETFPPKSSDLPLSLLSRSRVQSLVSDSSHYFQSSSRDVTGEMIGKLRSLLCLRGSSVRIFDGRSPQNICKVLLGESRGTLLKL